MYQRLKAFLIQNLYIEVILNTSYHKVKVFNTYYNERCSY